jgi:hypothetical protein
MEWRMLQVNQESLPRELCRLTGVGRFFGRNRVVDRHSPDNSG